MSEVSKAIGVKIRRHRTQMGLTQEELADKSGLHYSYIGQLERGEKNATLESIQRVVEALGISHAELYESNLVQSRESTPAYDCYEAVSALNLKEQKAIFDIVSKTIEYRKL
jgi:XRE family transcriptional regulator, regulator of sulfur utilization